MKALIRQALISAAAKAVIGAADWNRVKEVIAWVASGDVNGEKKRAIAIDELKKIGVSLSESLLNFAIEAAVAWLKQRSG